MAASLLDVKAIEMKFAFLTNHLVFLYGCYGLCCLEFYKFINAEKYDSEMVNGKIIR